MLCKNLLLVFTHLFYQSCFLEVCVIPLPPTFWRMYINVLPIWDSKFQRQTPLPTFRLPKPGPSLSLCLILTFQLGQYSGVLGLTGCRLHMDRTFWSL